jgi:hypothetical protein
MRGEGDRRKEEKITTSVAMRWLIGQAENGIAPALQRAG